MVGLVQRVADAAQVVDRRAHRVRVAEHAPLHGVGGADLAPDVVRGAVGIPDVPTDDEHRGSRQVHPVVAREVQPHPVGVLGVEHRPHTLEVRERARPEVVAHGGDLVQPLPFGEVLVTALDHLDAGLVGLLDVAPPELVEALEYVLERTVGQRHLEDIAGLYVTEAGAAVLALLPAHLPQPVRDLEGARLDVAGFDITKPLHVGILDPRLDGGRVPAADHHGRAHLHREGTLLLQMGEHRLEPLVQVGGVPVDDRPLGEVREIALDLGKLAVEDQPGAHHLAVLVEPSQVLRAPFSLHVSPRRDLAVTGRGQALDVRQMLFSADGPQGQAHAGRSSAGVSPSVRGSGSRAEAYCDRGRPVWPIGTGPDVTRAGPPAGALREAVGLADCGCAGQVTTPPKRPPWAIPR